ncbi:MAG TPA: ABC transporter substrate-binding protein [Thermodesulfobacteriota bacterium]|nr:ABC transporter substrate-binding protein [Thermodesulfobacteriota bacterium]
MGSEVRTRATAQADVPGGLTRRQLVERAGVSALGALLAGLPRGWRGGAYANDGPERRAIHLGIVPLADCAPIVMAHELGLFRKHGIESAISREASWATVRDRLAIGEIQAAQMLMGMPYASTAGVAGAPVRPVVYPFVLSRNGQGITLRKAFLDAGVRTPAALRPLARAAAARGRPLTFAMTFPSGTHAMWLRYWLAAGGLHPDRDVSLVAIPPPQMVANMKVGAVDGFCVGEPWNARAVADGVGFTAITSQAIWPDHPEKVLAFTEAFVERYPRTVRAILRAMVEASRFVDRLENRPRVAEVLARPPYLNVPAALVLGRLLGRYDYGDGRSGQERHAMLFHDRKANVPLRAHGIWFLTQFRRWGMLRDEPDYLGIARRVARLDLYRAVAEEMGLEVPGDEMAREVLFDGVVFDPTRPEAYAKGFAVHSLASA